MNKLSDLLERGVANIIPNKKILEGKLQNNKKLNIYLGIDPTSTKIHLGHGVVLRKLNQFAQDGHNVTFLIGDFTALIGDTSDKTSERPALSFEEIEENFKTYKKQAEKILDFSKIKVRFNSEWLRKLTFEDVIKLTQHFSVGDFVGRELIKKRLSENKRVGLHEFLYPVMQGYDSYILNTDLQLGGTDQTFNMQAGRTLIKDLKNKDSFVLTTPILEGTDGRKMSKSWGNAIWLDDNAQDMFAKIMAIKDELIIQYFTLATNIETKNIKIYEDRLKSENPINIKKELAYEITRELCGIKEAEKAQKLFENQVQKGELEITKTHNITDGYKNKLGLIDFIQSDLNINLSKSDLKRLFQQGGIELNGEKIKDPNFIAKFQNNTFLKIGKRNLIKIVIK